MRRTRVLAATAVLSLTLAPAAVAVAATPPAPVGSVSAGFDMDYVYSLMDNTNNSTDLNDGKSWLVRYYSRLSGAAGDTQATNPNPCQLSSVTGKNLYAVGGSATDLATNDIGTPGTPADQDCWWEFFNAWKATAAAQPAMSAANVTDHVYHLGEVDSNPYVSNPASLTASQPGPQNTVILTIPGAVHPEQTVVIGEHPDGASLSTFGSAYDDGQGAAVIIGVARAMLTYWTTHHEWPARTVQFVLFDGEEEGLFGSFFYQATQMPVGAVDANDYVGMFNVDQNGLEYPARHLGTQDKPDQGPWITNINETPTTNFSFYTKSKYPRLTSNAAAIAAFHTFTHDQVVQTFDQLGAAYKGKPMPLWDYPKGVPYPTGCQTTQELSCVDTFQDPADLQYIHDQDDTLGRTDQDPFIRCGVPALGLLGAYDSNGQEPVQGAPSGLPYAGYDTPVDNMAWLNSMASGSQPLTAADVSPANEIDPSKLGSEALRRALSFTGQFVTNAAGSAAMAGSVATPTYPVAYFQADRYAEKAGVADAFTAIPSPAAVSSYAWSFDDGTTATGTSVSHAFTTPGVHTVALTATGPGGSSHYSAAVRVVGPTADANTPCGEISGVDTTAYAPTFTAAAAPGTDLPESSRALLLPLVGIAAAGVAAVARTRRRRLQAR